MKVMSTVFPVVTFAESTRTPAIPVFRASHMLAPAAHPIRNPGEKSERSKAVVTLWKIVPLGHSATGETGTVAEVCQLFQGTEGSLTSRHRSVRVTAVMVPTFAIFVMFTLRRFPVSLRVT